MQPHIDYWLGRFSGTALPVLDLPLDRPRPAVRTFNSHRTERLLDKRLVAALRVASTKAGVSLFTGLLSGFVATLHRLSGQEDIVVGIPTSGQLAHDVPGLVGHCVNLLPLRIAAHTATRFDALMDECSTAVLDAFDHQALTYGALLSQLSLERDPSRLPLVSVAFNVDPDVASSAQAFTTLDVVQDTIPRRYENFELFVNLRPLDGGLQGRGAIQHRPVRRGQRAALARHVPVRVAVGLAQAGRNDRPARSAVQRRRAFAAGAAARAHSAGWGAAGACRFHRARAEAARPPRGARRRAKLQLQ
jgi:hypothetical protein